MLESLVREVVEGTTTNLFHYLFCVDLLLLKESNFQEFEGLNKIPPSESYLCHEWMGGCLEQGSWTGQLQNQIVIYVVTVP